MMVPLASPAMAGALAKTIAAASVHASAVRHRDASPPGEAIHPPRVECSIRISSWKCKLCLGSARRTQHAGARRARRIRRGQLRADAGHFRAYALERIIVAAVLVPRGELLTYAFERTAVAFIKRVGSRIEIVDDLQRCFFDKR